MLPVNLLPETILDILAGAVATRSLTGRDYQNLLIVASNQSLENDYHKSLQRLLRAVRRGFVRIVPDLDAVA